MSNRVTKCIKYLCPVCYNEHDSKEAASACCFGTIEGTERFLCNVCGGGWNNVDSAEECCNLEKLEILVFTYSYVETNPHATERAKLILNGFKERLAKAKELENG